MIHCARRGTVLLASMVSLLMMEPGLMLMPASALTSGSEAEPEAKKNKVDHQKGAYKLAQQLPLHKSSINIGLMYLYCIAPYGKSSTCEHLVCTITRRCGAFSRHQVFFCACGCIQVTCFWLDRCPPRRYPLWLSR